MFLFEDRVAEKRNINIFALAQIFACYASCGIRFQLGLRESRGTFNRKACFCSPKRYPGIRFNWSLYPDYALRVRGFCKNRQIALRGRFPSLIGRRRRGIDLRGIRCGNSGVTSVAAETMGDRPFLSAARFYWYRKRGIPLPSARRENDLGRKFHRYIYSAGIVTVALVSVPEKRGVIFGMPKSRRSSVLLFLEIWKKGNKCFRLKS